MLFLNQNNSIPLYDVRVNQISLNIRCQVPHKAASDKFSFSRRVEKEKAQAVEQQAKVSEQKKAQDLKAQMEAHLTQQRLAAQQVGELVPVPPGNELTFLANFMHTESTVMIYLYSFIFLRVSQTYLNFHYFKVALWLHQAVVLQKVYIFGVRCLK